VYATIQVTQDLAFPATDKTNLARSAAESLCPSEELRTDISRSFTELETIGKI
jgi:hypothetical protein